MKFAVNSKEMKRIDAYAIEKIGIPSMVLMERAASKVAERIIDFGSKKDKFLAVCGIGNNGGDAVAAARILYLLGYDTSVRLIGEECKASDQMKQQLQIARNLGMFVGVGQSMAEYTSIIDGIFGIGLSKSSEGCFLEAIKEINASNAMVYSVDIPSGISADNGQIMGEAVKADITVTFGWSKCGLLLYPGVEYAGKVFIEEIGFPDCLDRQASSGVCYYDESDIQYFPERSRNGNKGSFGTVLVIAGNQVMTGAACLAAEAAYRMGSGLVKVLTSKQGVAALHQRLPEALTEEFSPDFEENTEKVERLLSTADVVLFGSGIGISSFSRQLLTTILGKVKVPLVLDADALNILAANLDQEEEQLSENEKADWREDVFSGRQQFRTEKLKEWLPMGTIVTPHLKELSRLLRISVPVLAADLIDIANRSAYNNSLVYVCKDARTVIGYSHNCYLNVSGNHGMATGGSGDVLAGMISGLLAGGMLPYEAAKLGVYLHGLSGDAAARKMSAPFMLASDILSSLQDIFISSEKTHYAKLRAPASMLRLT